MPVKKASVLVVDDDIRILRLMRRVLEREGYRVLTVADGEAALNAFDEEVPDLVLLDLLMPGMDGYTVCRRIREFSQVPIVMVTAKDSEEDKVDGLEAGADDYITKPFALVELIARVKAMLRRSRLWDERPQPAFHSGDLTIDFARRRVTLGGQEVNLTATEYKLLSYLVRNAGRVLTPNQILEKVWGEEYTDESHVLRVTMSRLRQKLGDNPRKPRFIATKVGIGYSSLKPLSGVDVCHGHK
jgi:DNA-binding response OmpR family regulator